MNSIPPPLTDRQREQIDEAIGVVGPLWRVDLLDLRGRLRTKSMTSARSDFCRLLRKMHWNLVDIGRVLHRDHTTIVYYLKRETVSKL